MMTRFIEASNGFNHGKFMVAQFDFAETQATSALPGYEGESLWTLGGRRKLGPAHTLVVDLQTGEGAAFDLGATRSLSAPAEAAFQLRKHRIWVCPLFEPFLAWLYLQDAGLERLPRYVDLKVEGAVFGYRREGPSG